MVNTVYTKAATDAAITAAIGGLVGAAPSALNTLKEIDDQLTADEGAAAALAAAVAGKEPAGLSASTQAALAATYRTVVTVPVATGVAATDWANISAAVTRAQGIVAAGGSPVVVFPGCPTIGGTFTPYSLGNHTIPVTAGVHYLGQPPVLAPDAPQAGQYMPDGEQHFIGGTVLTGDGTADGFSGNTTAAASPNASGFGNTSISGVRIYGFGGSGLRSLVNVGARNVMGLVWSELDELYVRNSTGWGVRAVNFQHLRVGRIFTWSAGIGGQFYGVDLPGVTLANGNSTFAEIMHKPANGAPLERGIVFSNDGTPGGLGGQINIGRAQINAFNRAKISQTVTVTNGSANITVTDGSKFAVGLPIVFTTAANGFQWKTVYVVQTVTGATITVGASRSTAAVAATGSGTMTVESWGMPCFEVVAPTAGNTWASFNVASLDLEGNTTAAAYVENLTAADINVSSVPASNESHAGLVSRSGQHITWRSAAGGAVTDFDAASANGSHFYGDRGAMWGWPLAGQWTEGSTGVLAISQGYLATTGGDIATRNQGFLYPTLAGFGRGVTTVFGNMTLGGADCGTVVSALSTATTLTLPAVHDESDPGNSTVGLWYEIMNYGAATITVTRSGTDQIGKAGVASFTIAPGYSALIHCVKDSVSGAYWAGRSAAPLISATQPTTDSFTRADSTTSMGTTETNGRAWANLNGATWGITGGQAYNAGGTGGGITVINTGTADHSIQAKVNASDGGTAVLGRVTDANNWVAFLIAASGNMQVYRNVGGSTSDIAFPGTFAAGDTFKLDFAGGTGHVSKNGTIVATFADATTGTKAGFRADSNGARFDDLVTVP